MKDVLIAKARGTMDSDDSEPAIIRITERVPDFNTHDLPWEGIVRTFYDTQAEAIVDALLSLPGGTLDRVLAKLISRSVSWHRIPWEAK